MHPRRALATVIVICTLALAAACACSGRPVGATADAGAGLVVETRADPRVALRFSLGAMLGAGLGAQATLDWDPRGRRTTLALVGRLSF